MSNTVVKTATKPSLTSALIGSVVGGMVFGMLMQMMSMMKSVAMLVNSNSVGVGWVVHLAISMIFGLVYYLIAKSLPSEYPGALVGLMYGVLLWVGGALFLMPAKLHMPTFHFDSMAWKSLMGHMIFGVILGVITAGRKLSK